MYQYSLIGLGVVCYHGNRIEQIQEVSISFNHTLLCHRFHRQNDDLKSDQNGVSKCFFGLAFSFQVQTRCIYRLARGKFVRLTMDSHWHRTDCRTTLSQTMIYTIFTKSTSMTSQTAVYIRILYEIRRKYLDNGEKILWIEYLSS